MACAMMNSLKNLHPPLKSSATRHLIEFDTKNEGKIGIEILQNRWDWPQIQRLLDEVFLYSTHIRNTTTLNTNLETLAKNLYPFLPDSKVELKKIIQNAKRYYRSAHRGGTPAAKAILLPYIRQLHALIWAARQKLSVMLCLPNQRQWDIRAYRLFLELQNNLGQMRRAHFVTLTFKGDPSYALIKEQLRKFKRKLNDQGLDAVSVVSLHPGPHTDGRMHAHLLVWTRQTLSASQDKSAVNKCRAFLKSSKSSFGHFKWTPVSNRMSFVKVAAYVSWNYDQTIKLVKGQQNPIPKLARVLSRPKRVVCGRLWARIAKSPLVTPAATSWTKAVARYAAARGRSLAGDRRWIWRERRSIREYLEPESWWEASVTGLDGHTYRVIPAGEDHGGNETYLISSEERGGFYLTDAGLEGLAKLQVAPGALSKNDQLDQTTGKTACCYEVLGMLAFM
jgi:hypothetical protein